MGNKNQRTGLPFQSQSRRRDRQLEKRKKREKEEYGALSIVPFPPPRSPPARRPNPQPTSKFDFMRLFSTKLSDDKAAGNVEGNGTQLSSNKESELEYKLKKIRENIMLGCWSRNRKDRSRCDFIVDDYETRRNVSYFTIFEGPSGRLIKKSVGESFHSLLFVNKAISAEFIEAVYSTNTLEIEFNIKALHTKPNTMSLNLLIANLQASPHFREYTQMVTVCVHWPSATEYRDAGLPAANRDTLVKLVSELNNFKSLTSLRVKIYFSGKVEDMFELTYSALPFYALHFEDWQLHAKLNGRHFFMGAQYSKVCDQVFLQQRRQLDRGELLTFPYGPKYLPWHVVAVSKKGVTGTASYEMAVAEPSLVVTEPSAAVVTGPLAVVAEPSAAATEPPPAATIEESAVQMDNEDGTSSVPAVATTKAQARRARRRANKSNPKTRQVGTPPRRKPTQASDVVPRNERLFPLLSKESGPKKQNKGKTAKNAVAGPAANDGPRTSSWSEEVEEAEDVENVEDVDQIEKQEQKAKPEVRSPGPKQPCGSQ